jgi:hypothetical protein
MLGCLPESYADEPKNILEHYFSENKILGFRKGNFTNSGKDEYVVFLDRKDKRKEITDRLIYSINVAVVNGDQVIKNYKVEGASGIFEYNDSFLPIITNSKVNWGKWDGLCCVRDYNGNGLDEILFFEITGMSFLPYIFEYSNREMRTILEPPPTPTNQVMKFEAQENRQEKSIMIWGWGEGKKYDALSGKRDWYKYVWNKKVGKYAIVEKGME